MSVVLSMVVVICSLFFLCLVSTIFGAGIGWVVGLFFSEPILGFLNRASVDVNGLHMWQVGAALGFIGSFFKSTLTHNGK